MKFSKTHRQLQILNLSNFGGLEKRLSFRPQGEILYPSDSKISQSCLLRNDKVRELSFRSRFIGREIFCPAGIAKISLRLGRIDMTMEWFGMTKRSCHFDRREKSWGVAKITPRLRRVEMTRRIDMTVLSLVHFKIRKEALSELPFGLQMGKLLFSLTAG